MRRLLFCSLGFLLVLAALLPLAAAAADATVQVTKNDALGSFLIDTKGMTLYIYTRDTADTSNCYDACATAWPPLLVSSGDPVAPAGLGGKLATTTRKDGSHQVTYNGQPLYYFAKDAKPGDTTGQGVGSVWYVIAPSATTAATVAPVTGHASRGFELPLVLGLGALAALGASLALRRGFGGARLSRD